MSSKNVRIEVWRDRHPEDPRKDYGHSGTMVCWHPRYSLGDEQPTENAMEWRLNVAEDIDAEGAVTYWYDRSLQDVNSRYSELMLDRAVGRVLGRELISLPLFLYDHSGLEIYTKQSDCWAWPWDFCQVGWIYITKDMACQLFGVKRLFQKARKSAIEMLKAEVLEYGHYISGRMWSCAVFGEDGGLLGEISGVFGYQEDILVTVKEEHPEYVFDEEEDVTYLKEC